MKDERRRPRAPRLAQGVLWGVLTLLYAPIVMMLAGAFLDRSDGDANRGLSWGLNWTLKWFEEVLQDASLTGALKNSLAVALSSSLISTILGTLAALGLFRSQGKIRNLLQGLSVISLVFPEIVFALSLLCWFFVLGWGLGLHTVIFAHVSFSLSYVMMTVTARLSSLDLSLEDAARDLGASEAVVLRTVLLPLLKPAILGGFMLSFLLSFDDFLITYFVNGAGNDTLPVKLYTSLKMGVSPKLNALSSMMFIITFGVLILFFKTSAFRALFEGKRDGE